MAESVSPTTRDRILAVAVEAVQRSPVSTVSMKQIADHVGIATPSIYKAYANRYELFADACRLVFENQLAEIAHDASAHDDPLDALEEVLTSLFEVGRAEPYASSYLYGVFPLQYHGQVGDAVMTRVQHVTTEAVNRLRTRIDAAVAAGQLHGQPDKLTELCAIISFGFIGGSVHHDRLITPAELASYTIAALQAVT